MKLLNLIGLFPDFVVFIAGSLIVPAGNGLTQFIVVVFNLHHVFSQSGPELADQGSEGIQDLPVIAGGWLVQAGGKQDNQNKGGAGHYNLLHVKSLPESYQFYRHPFRLFGDVLLSVIFLPASAQWGRGGPAAPTKMTAKGGEPDSDQVFKGDKMHQFLLDVEQGERLDMAHIALATFSVIEDVCHKGLPGSHCLPDHGTGLCGSVFPLEHGRAPANDFRRLIAVHGQDIAAGIGDLEGGIGDNHRLIELHQLPLKTPAKGPF